MPCLLSVLSPEAAPQTTPLTAYLTAFLPTLQVIRRKAAMSAGAQAAPSAELPSSSTSTPQGERIQWTRSSRAAGYRNLWEGMPPPHCATPGPAQTLPCRGFLGQLAFLWLHMLLSRAKVFWSDPCSGAVPGQHEFRLLSLQARCQTWGTSRGVA